MALHVEILSPAKVLYKGDADDVVAPAILGEVDILPHHTEYVTLLEKGTIRVKKAGQVLEYPVESGLLTVKNDQMTILIES